MYESKPPLLWPRYIERHIIDRTLAYYQDHRLHLEDGTSYLVRDWDELASLLFSRNLLTFVSSLVTFEYVAELVSVGKVYCTKEGHPTSARLRAQNKSTRWLVESQPWGQHKPTLEFLRFLRRFYEHMDVGTIPSPGSLGMATMRHVWKMTWGMPEVIVTVDKKGIEEEREGYGGWKAHRHQRPPSMCCEDLYEHSTGARSDLLEYSKVYDQLIEVDRKNAFAAEFGEQPTGRTIRFGRGHVEGFKVWVATCEVTIPEPGLKWGCFPVKEVVGKEETSQTYYPTKPGNYQAWLWSVDVELAREEGCLVQVGAGWGWYETTTDPQHWVDWVSMKRDTAEEKEIADLVKLIIVAGQGRHGMRPDFFELTTEQHEGDKQAIGIDPDAKIGFVYDWWIHATRNLYPSELPHWYQHMLAKMRVALFKAAKKYREQELLVATNTDAFYVKQGADVLQYKRKADPSRSTGDWSWRTIYDARLPAKRHLIARDEQGNIIEKRPGHPKKLRPKKGDPYG